MSKALVISKTQFEIMMQSVDRNKIIYGDVFIEIWLETLFRAIMQAFQIRISKESTAQL